MAAGRHIENRFSGIYQRFIVRITRNLARRSKTTLDIGRVTKMLLASDMTEKVLLKNWYMRMPSSSFQLAHETVNNVCMVTPVSGLTMQLPLTGGVFSSKSRNDIPCSPDCVVTCTPARYWVSPLNITKPSVNSRSEMAIFRDWQPVTQQFTRQMSHSR